MKRLSPIDRRLAASWHQRHIEIVAKADAIAAAVGKRIDAAGRKIIGYATTGEANAATYHAIKREWARVIPELLLYLDPVMRSMIRYSDRDAKDRLAVLVPRGWWRMLFPRMRESITEAGPTRGNAFDRLFGPGAFVAGAEPALKGQGTLSDEEYAKLVRQTILPPLMESEVEAIVKSPNPHTGDSWQKRLTDLSSKVKSPDALAGEIVTGIANGENVQQIRDRVDLQVGKLNGSAQRIARTEARRVAEMANRKSWESLGELLDGAQIIAVLDERTRPKHAARHGTIYRKGGVPRFEDLPILPDEPNCVLPGNVVRGEFVGGLKAKYSGQAFEFRTRAGRTFTVTPNHRVLTEHGFLPAAGLKVGDKLVRYLTKEERPIGMANHEYDEPIAIEQVFRSLKVSSGALRGKTKGLNLHGDGKFVKGYIEIVTTNGQLLLDRESLAKYGGYKSAFAGTNVEAFIKAGGCAFPGHGFGIATSAAGGPSGIKLLCDTGRVFPEVSPLNFLSVGLCSVFRAAFNEQFCQPSGLSIVEAAASHTDFDRQLIERFPGVVATDQIIDIDTFWYDGHVYDLQSNVEWYWCNDIIIHNCRCTAAPVLKTPSEVANDPKVAAAFSNEKGQHIPDPAAYDQWFKQADEPRRRQAVGSGRYDVVKRRTATTGDKPEWKDFIKPDGSLVPVQTLKRETAAAASERKVDVAVMLANRENLFRQIAMRPFTIAPTTAELITVGVARQRIIDAGAKIAIAAPKTAKQLTALAKAEAAAIAAQFPNVDKEELLADVFLAYTIAKNQRSALTQ